MVSVVEVKLIDTIKDVNPAAWNAITGTHYPFIRHEFLSALEQSGSVSEAAGWQPKHCLVLRQNELVAVMPLYLKYHSRGEYVFDSQWAQSYNQCGLDYYPKWLTAIPFTPCCGPRLAVKHQDELSGLTRVITDYIKDLSVTKGIASWHCLFPSKDVAEIMTTMGLHLRTNVQFHWHNRNYRDFDDYLDQLVSSKRKQIKRERRKIKEQGIELLRISGRNISHQQWQVFFQFYQLTYHKNGMLPYLNFQFFLLLAELMPSQLLLVMAVKNNRYVGAALSLVGSDTLFGRYWGCYQEFNSLHFEACYYQGLEYCIANGYEKFDSGAQGEHKIARGFEPTFTYSTHWIQNKELSQAIAHFLTRERPIIDRYKQEAENLLPFKKVAQKQP